MPFGHWGITIVVSPLLCHGCGGGRSHPLPSCEHNKLLVSNSNNTTLVASVSPLPPAPGKLAAVPPSIATTTATAVIQYTNTIATLAHGSKPEPVADPIRLHCHHHHIQTTLMISILAKNDMAKKNSVYSSLDAIKGMRTKITSLARPILVTVWVEKLDPYAAMENLLSLSVITRITKWCHVESIVKFWFHL